MRLRNLFGLAILFFAALIAGLNLLALKYFLFWRLWWFDIPMHILGGFIIGSIALWLVAYEVPISIRLKINRLLVAILVTLVIGIAWEIFEYQVGITKGEPGYWFDTVHDVIDDVIGGLMAYLALNRHGR
jgi:hypothetical protein